MVASHEGMFSYEVLMDHSCRPSLMDFLNNQVTEWFAAAWWSRAFRGRRRDLEFNREQAFPSGRNLRFQPVEVLADRLTMNPQPACNFPDRESCSTEFHNDCDSTLRQRRCHFEVHPRDRWSMGWRCVMFRSLTQWFINFILDEFSTLADDNCEHIIQTRNQQHANHRS